MKQQKTGTKIASPMTGPCQRAALWPVWLISLDSPMLNSSLLQVSDVFLYVFANFMSIYGTWYSLKTVFMVFKKHINRRLIFTYMKKQIVSSKWNLKKDQLKNLRLYKEYLLHEEPSHKNQVTAWCLSPSREPDPTGIKFLSLF